MKEHSSDTHNRPPLDESCAITHLKLEIQQLRTTLQSSQKRYYSICRLLKTSTHDIEAMKTSRTWLWGSRLQRLHHEFIKGGWGGRLAFVRKVVSKILRRLLRRPVLQTDQQQQASLPADPNAWYESGIADFLKAAAAAPSEWIYFIFAGSSFIQEKRGHRLMGIARALRARGIPVFYSYNPWAQQEVIPKPDDPLLFQSPAYLTMKKQSEIIRYNFRDKKRVYLIGYPHPFCARSVDEINSLGWITHYDCMDEWEEFHKEGAGPWYTEGAERTVVACSDIVTATADVLVQKMQHYTNRKQVQLSRNALSSSFITPDIAGHTAPREGPFIVGYVGHLAHWWFDWRAMKEVAERMSDVTFEIVGFALPDDVKMPDNVKLLGPKDHDEVRQIALRWRAAMVMRKVSPLTAAMDSLKVYEYLALGLPMVCFSMPQIASYPYVFSSSTVDEFVQNIQRAATMPIDRATIDEFLASNHWEDRVEQYLQLARTSYESPSLIRGIQALERVT